MLAALLLLATLAADVLSSAAGPRAADGSETYCEVKVNVQDPAGASTRNAQVVFTRKDHVTKSIFKGTTDASGQFRTKLPAGDYNLQVASAGFRRYDKNVQVACPAAKAAAISVRLELGITQGD